VHELYLSNKKKQTKKNVDDFLKKKIHNQVACWENIPSSQELQPSGGIPPANTQFQHHWIFSVP
jgi:hypothetical protein